MAADATIYQSSGAGSLTIAVEGRLLQKFVPMILVGRVWGDRLRVVDNGNVGINTDVPTGKLQVHNDGSGIKVLNADSDPNVFLRFYGGQRHNFSQ